MCQRLSNTLKLSRPEAGVRCVDVLVFWSCEVVGKSPRERARTRVQKILRRIWWTGSQRGKACASNVSPDKIASSGCWARYNYGPPPLLSSRTPKVLNSNVIIVFTRVLRHACPLTWVGKVRFYISNSLHFFSLQAVPTRDPAWAFRLSAKVTYVHDLLHKSLHIWFTVILWYVVE